MVISRPAILFLCLALVACDRHPAAAPIAPAAPALSADAPRIVCLAPTLTKMVADLGLLDRVVAVAQYDTVAPPDLPVVGNYVDVDVERLLSVEPTLVLTMAAKEGVPPRLQQLADTGRFRLHAWTNPDPFTLDQIMNVLLGVGDALGSHDQAEALRRAIVADLAAVQQAVIDRPSPRVLLVIGTDPVMACGPRTAHDQLLRFAGGANAAAGAAVTAPTYDREALIAMQPDVILLLEPNGLPLANDDERLRNFRGLPVPAVTNGRVVLLNDPFVLLTSTSVARTVRDIAQAVHPDAELPDAP